MHQFVESDAGWEEAKAIKLSREKDWNSKDAVRATDDLLVVTSSTKGNAQEGAIVLYERTQTGKWRKLEELRDASGGDVTVVEEEVFLSFSTRFYNRGCLKHVYPRAGGREDGPPDGA